MKVEQKTYTGWKEFFLDAANVLFVIGVLVCLNGIVWAIKSTDSGLMLVWMGCFAFFLICIVKARPAWIKLDTRFLSWNPLKSGRIIRRIRWEDIEEVSGSWDRELIFSTRTEVTATMNTRILTRAQRKQLYQDLRTNLPAQVQLPECGD